jgi:hypothetical protein
MKLEAEMNRLLQETSAGPYEQATSVVEQHLREQLDRARRENHQSAQTRSPVSAAHAMTSNGRFACPTGGS